MIIKYDNKMIINVNMKNKGKIGTFGQEAFNGLFIFQQDTWIL